MRIIKPSFEFMEPVDGKAILQLIEAAGRTCYKSEGNITENSAESFVASLIRRGHESVLEHAKITIRIICNRGVSHELVRHRLASYSQESTRFCNYSKNSFGNEITVIEPWFFSLANVKDDLVEQSLMADKFALWKSSMLTAEKFYFGLLNLGATPQEARSVLPNSLKTEIVMTANLREWRTIFKQRTSKATHPQMIEIMNMILAGFKERIPIIFDDIYEAVLKDSPLSLSK